MKNEYYNDIVTKLYGKELILKQPYLYYGIVTKQLLPSGGIQTLFEDKMIIKINDGFIAVEEVIYDNKLYSISEFSKLYDNLINTVLKFDFELNL